MVADIWNSITSVMLTRVWDKVLNKIMLNRLTKNALQRCWKLEKIPGCKEFDF